MEGNSQNCQIVIAGGSGFVGLSLAQHLAAAGHRVVILSRHQPKVAGPWRHVAWDARTLGDWSGELEGAAGLVNLVGRSVDCIKTPDHQDEILRSRVEATRVLGQAMRSLAAPPPVWVQMSTAHIYGDPPEVDLHRRHLHRLRVCPVRRPGVGRSVRRQRLPPQRQVIFAHELRDRPRPRRGGHAPWPD